jgi:hypothetical protein
MALSLASLLDIATRSAAVSGACNCTTKSLAGWEGWPASLREDQFQKVGSLINATKEESTIDEYHPNGTSFWSPDAPIAPHYYPYNQCDVWECVKCSRVYLRYNDDGAYHSESRVRALDPALIVDPR